MLHPGGEVTWTVRVCGADGGFVPDEAHMMKSTCRTSAERTAWSWPFRRGELGKPVTTLITLSRICAACLLRSSLFISERHAAFVSGLGSSRTCRHHLRAEPLLSTHTCRFGDSYNLWGTLCSQWTYLLHCVHNGPEECVSDTRWRS